MYHPATAKKNYSAPPPVFTKMARTLYYKLVGRYRDIEVLTTSLSQYII